MKRTLKRLLGCAGVVCALVLALHALGDLVEYKRSMEKCRTFFEQQADYDVLFFGTSHVINAVFPMELWKDCGIVSYNFGGHSTYIPSTYWVLRCALDYTTPKLAVVDCAYLDLPEKANQQLEWSHYLFDAFPFTLTKWQAVRDILHNPAVPNETEPGHEKRMPIGLLWPFSVYHQRWTDLGQEDFAPVLNPEKGAESRIALDPQPPAAPLPQSEKMPADTVALQYLRRIIEECQARNIEVLLTFLPYTANEIDRRAANTVYDVAREYNVGYLDLLNTDLIDRTTDCYDEGHLNPSGARKITGCIGQYIRQNYAIPDRRQDPVYAGWNTDYAAYEQFKADTLAQQTDLELGLMLLADKNLDAVLWVQEPAALQAGLCPALLQNLGLDAATLPADAPYLIVCKGGRAVWSAPAGAQAALDTPLGPLCVQDGTLTLGGTVCLPPLPAEQSAAVRAAVLFNDTGAPAATMTLTAGKNGAAP